MRNALSPFLNVSNVPAAVRNASGYYGLGVGTEANQSTLSTVITDAAFDFGQPPNDLFSISTTPEPNPIMINQHVYAEAFAQLLQQLDQNNQSALVQAFADNIGATMTDIQTSHNVRPDYTGPLLELAHVANLDQSFVYAFQQFSANGLSPLSAANEVASLDNNTQQYLVANNPIDPSLLISFRAAAATVFGFNTQTLSQAKGNTSQVGTLLLGSAALSTGSLAAAAQRLSGSVAAGLSEEALQQAHLQAISQALQPATSASERPSLFSPNATAILAAASVSAKQASAISQSFAQAAGVDVSSFCDVAKSAQAISSAAQQAVLSAIPKSYGSQPCK